MRKRSRGGPWEFDNSFKRMALEPSEAKGSVALISFFKALVQSFPDISYRYAFFTACTPPVSPGPAGRFIGHADILCKCISFFWMT